MYWTDVIQGKIHRANLNGLQIEDIVTGLKKPFGITLDLNSHKIYWVDWDWDTDTYKIQRADLDGSNVRDLFTGLNRPSEIVLDTDGFYDVTPDANKVTTTWAKVKSK